MKTELIERLIEMLLAGESKPQNVTEKQMIGEYVIVRCRDAGVHAGYLVDYSGREVILKDSRRLWYWKSANHEHTLSGVARHGLVDGCRIAGSVTSMVLNEACEIISTTENAKDSIHEYDIHKTS